MLTRTWASADGRRRVVIGLHRRAGPSVGAWNEYINALADALALCDGDYHRATAFSITEGGGPDARQREQLKAFLRRATDGRGKVAIVTADPVGRGIIKALNWFNPDTQAFAPHELSRAIEYLELGPFSASFEQELDDALIQYPLACVPSKVSR